LLVQSWADDEEPAGGLVNAGNFPMLIELEDVFDPWADDDAGRLN
jgi:hypothetical protein